MAASEYAKTEVYLLKDICIDDENKLNNYGMSEQTQVSIFLGGNYESPSSTSKTQLELLTQYTNCVWLSHNFSNIKIDQGYIEVPMQLEGLTACNYLMFRNRYPQNTTTELETLDIDEAPKSQLTNNLEVSGRTWYENMFMFAFIDRFETLNGNNTKVYFSIDVMTTYLPYCSFGNSYIEREHDDANKPWNYDFIPEDWGSPNELLTVKVGAAIGKDTDYLLCKFSADPSYIYEDARQQGEKYNVNSDVFGLPNGNVFYAFSINNLTGIEDFFNILSKCGTLQTFQGISILNNENIDPDNFNVIPPDYIRDQKLEAYRGVDISGAVVRFIGQDEENQSLWFNKRVFDLDISNIVLSGEFNIKNGGILYLKTKDSNSSNGVVQLYPFTKSNNTYSAPYRSNEISGVAYLDLINKELSFSGDLSAFSGEVEYFFSGQSLFPASTDIKKVTKEYSYQISPPLPVGASVPQNNKTYASSAFFLNGEQSLEIPIEKLTETLNLSIGIDSVENGELCMWSTDLQGINDHSSFCYKRVSFREPPVSFATPNALNMLAIQQGAIQLIETKRADERIFNHISNLVSGIVGIASENPVQLSASIKSSVAQELKNKYGEQEQANLINSFSTDVSSIVSSVGTQTYLAQGYNYFSYTWKYHNYTQFKAIDDFYSLYGYKVNRVGKPKIVEHSAGYRQKWNYCKGNIEIMVNAPTVIRDQIKNAFTNGVRFWNSQGLDTFSAKKIGFFNVRVDSANPNA